MIFLNYKTYELGTGKKAVDFTQIVQQVATDSQIKIIPVVQPGDIKEIASTTTLEVWSQIVDPIEYGAHTGGVLAQAVLEDGAQGTFLNHSEHRFENSDELKKANEIAKGAGLKTLIFAKDLTELSNLTPLSPDFLAYEPPELIGKSDVSVASAQPEIVSKAVEIAKKAGLPLIVGAGIHSLEDVHTSLSLGASGVAVASDIMKAQDPRGELLNLVEGFK